MSLIPLDYRLPKFAAMVFVFFFTGASFAASDWTFITKVHREPETQNLLIGGQGFQEAGKVSLPYVELGGVALEVVEASPLMIVAKVPESMTAGEYNLLVERTIPGKMPKKLLNTRNVSVFSLTLR